ncbi:hypothetical protein OAA09_00475 [bacterium]|nr:hypothetical protein [bacterium]
MPVKKPTKKTKLVTQSKKRSKVNKRKFADASKILLNPKTSRKIPRILSRGGKFKFKNVKRSKNKQVVKKTPLTIESTPDQYLARAGVSKRRPEILFQMNYIPAYSSDGKTKKRSIHDIIDAQKSQRELMLENSGEILEQLKSNPDFEDELNIILESYDNTIAGLHKIVEQLGKVIDRVNQSKKKLDFKVAIEDIVEDYNDREQSRVKRSKERLKERYDKAKDKAEAARLAGGDASYYNKRANNALSGMRKLRARSLESAADIMLETGFTKSNYINFSNTKILSQVLFDLKSTLLYHSPNLIGKNLNARRKDSHPFNIDDEVRSGSPGKLGAFSLADNNQEASLYKAYKEAMLELPNDDTDRFRVLVNELAKESRYSINAANPVKVEKIIEATGMQPSGNSIFNAVFGNPENALSPKGSNSGFSSVIQRDLDGKVLSFENGYVRSRDGSLIFSPGTTALADFILESGVLDTSRYASVARDFMLAVNDTYISIDNLYYLPKFPRINSSPKRLSNSAIGTSKFDFHGDSLARALYTNALNVVHYASSGVYGGVGSPQTINEEGILAFLMDLADNNREAKFIITLMCLVVRRKMMLEEDEALKELLAEDEELTKLLERENLLAQLGNPDGRSLSPQKELIAEFSSKKTSDIFSKDIDSFTSSAQAQKFIDQLQEYLMKRCIPKTYGRSKKSSHATDSRGRSKSNRSFKGSKNSSLVNSGRRGVEYTSSISTTVGDLIGSVEDGYNLTRALEQMAKNYERFLLSGKVRVSPQGVQHAMSVGSELNDDLNQAAAVTRSARAAHSIAKGTAVAQYAAAAEYDRMAGVMEDIANSPFSAAMKAHQEGAVTFDQSSYDAMYAHSRSSGTGAHFGAMADHGRSKANDMRASADLYVANTAASMETAQARQDLIASARRALQRRAVDVVPDIFVLVDPNTSKRFSRFNGISEDIFEMLYAESQVTILGEIYNVNVTKFKDKSSAAGTFGHKRSTITFRINNTYKRASIAAARGLLGYTVSPKNYAEEIDDIEAEYYERSQDFFEGSEDALEEERFFISKRMRVLSLYGKSLVGEGIRLNGYFNINKNTSRRMHKNVLKGIMSGPGGPTIISALNDQQIHLKHYMVESLSCDTEEKKRIPVPDYDKFKAGQYFFLDKMMRQTKFRSSRADNLNIVAVGLPCGMIKDLSTSVFDNSPSVGPYDPYRKNKLVKIKVFKRDQQFDDLVFKPISYTYDASRLLSPVDSFSEIQAKDEFEAMLKEKVKYIDYGIHGRIEKDGESYEEVINSDDFQAIRSRYRKQVVLNTLYSEGLKYYIKLLSGINLNEQEFFLHPDFSLGKKLIKQTAAEKSIIDSVLTTFLKQEGVETEAQYNEHLSLINQLTSFTNSSIFNARKSARTALQPTLFDRIYCIPVDPDSFVIDIKKTNSTRSGRLALRTAINSNQVKKRRGRYKLKSRKKSEGKVSIYEYFVTVEILESPTSQQRKDTKRELRNLSKKPGGRGTSMWSRFLEAGTGEDK